MSYDPDSIEIRADGAVICAGEMVGTISFAGRDGILGRMRGVGVHSRTDGDEFALEELEEEVHALKGAIRRAAAILNKKDADVPAALSVLRAAVE